MSKMTLTCKSFRPFQRNTLFGFAEILVEEIGLRIKDVTVFEKNGKRWAGAGQATTQRWHGRQR